MYEVMHYLVYVMYKRKQTNLEGNGLSTTAWESATIAACCCSVNGAFCPMKQTLAKHPTKIKV